MPKVDPKTIAQSFARHAEHSGAGITTGGARCNRAKTLMGYTSDGSRDTSRRPMYNRRTATPEDRYWRALLKQVMNGSRITVRYPR